MVENLIVGQHVRAASLGDLLVPFRLMPNHRWRREALEALAEAGLEAYAGDTVSELPYGIRKRIDLVRATLAGAQLLMLDNRPPDSIRRKPTRCALISIFSRRVASRFWSSSMTCISSAMSAITSWC